MTKERYNEKNLIIKQQVIFCFLGSISLLPLNTTDHGFMLALCIPYKYGPPDSILI